MTTFEEFLDTIPNEENRTFMQELVNWVRLEFPELAFKIAWKQPMFTHHETFIIGFSVAKKHISIAPEAKVIKLFSKQISDANYTQSDQLFRIKYSDSIDHNLLRNIIQYNIDDKQHCSTFWRK